MGTGNPTGVSAPVSNTAPYGGASSVASGQPIPSYPSVDQQYAQAPPGYVPQPSFSQQAPPGYYNQQVPVTPVVVITPGLTGYRTLPPRVPPQPGMSIVGWETSRPEIGCCQCETLSMAGWMSVILLLFFFFPLAWMPCLMDDCHDRVARPVYGYPQQGPPQQQQQQQYYYPQPAPPTGSI